MATSMVSFRTPKFTQADSRGRDLYGLRIGTVLRDGDVVGLPLTTTWCGFTYSFLVCSPA